MANMKKTALHSSTFRDIRGSLGRFFAIFAIIALGVGFFSGVRITTPTMVHTFDEFYKEKKLFDYKLVSTIGWEEKDVEEIRKKPGVTAAEGGCTYDIICLSAEGSDEVYKAHLLPDKVNQLRLLEGRLPKNQDEVLVDNKNRSGLELGDTLHFADSNAEEDLKHFNGNSFRIVGFADSSLYINFERGTTSLGTGIVSGFLYFTKDVFADDIYTEIYVDMDAEGDIYSEEYDAKMDALRSDWEKITDDAAQERADRIREESAAKIEDAKKELTEEKEKNTKKLADAKKELDEAAQKLADSEQELKDGEQKLKDGKAELEKSEKELEDGKKELDGAKSKLDSGRSELEKARKTVDAGKKQLDEKAAEIKAGKEKLNAAKKQLDQAKAALADATPLLNIEKGLLEATKAELDREKQRLEKSRDYLLDSLYQLAYADFQRRWKGYERASQTYRNNLRKQEDGQKRYEAGLAEYEKGRKELEAGEKLYQAGYSEWEKGNAQYREAEKQYQKGLSEYNAGYARYENGLRQYREGLAQYDENVKKWEDGKKELEEGHRKYEDGLREYEDGKKEFEEKIAEAEEKIEDADQKLSQLEDPDTFLLERNTNIGYSCFQSDSDIVAQIAKIFPIFFILVAALVCMTTMTRMVEEKRGEIGVLKALGYSGKDIALKFTTYSGLASMMGCIIGYGLGIIIFPSVIWITYKLMYIHLPLQFVFDWKLALIAVVVSLVCSVGVTLISCRYELSETAAGLMRPKAPKPGKRVFLERIPAIWNRLKFLHKVSIRNIFRYKGRFLMMVVGIGGSMALLLTGFGLKDSIAGFAETQFEEIQTTDIEVDFRDGRKGKAPEKLTNQLDEKAESYILCYSGSWELIKDKTVKSINLIVPQADKDFQPFFHLSDLEDNPLSVPEKGSVLIGAALADRYNLKEGDEIALRSDDLETVKLRVAGIFRSHIYNYVIASPEDIDRNVNMAYVLFAEGTDVYQAQASFAECESVSYVNVFKDFKERMAKMMNNLNYIVLIVVLSAAGLALVVLYNLTNINITERIREIATIKVLGFYPNETGQYVFRENVLLTFFGMIAGLGLGVLLHRYVMSQITVDMVYFNKTITPLSYLYSVILIFVFTFLVNLFMRTKLERINMAESLKSVE
ncbi:MAG: FtsX-like permease family protein [Eubacterium sp.]|nr:FtsX-like permease family protein [Eubacterium sp.]